MHGVPGAGGDLLEGIVLGDRRRLLGTATDEEFRILGLSHLVAVSGSHLALACGAVALVGRLVGLRRRSLVLATVLAGASYAVVTGMPYSALRSLMMLAVAGLSVVAGRRADGQSSLAVSVIAVLAVEPWSVFDLGFQLSVLAVAGLLVFGGLATEWAVTGVQGPMRLIAGTLALTFVAQVLTAPVVASTFGMISLLAPVANAYAAPLVSSAMFVGLAGAVAGSLLPGLGEIAARGAAAILGAAAWIAHHLAGLPGAAVVIGSGPWLVGAVVVLAAGVWFAWPLPKDARRAQWLGVAVLILTCALALGPAPARRAEIVVLDVGQGDAILVRDGGRTMLVDAGPDATVLRQALSRHGVRRIDTLVLTHAHDDHTAGAAGLPGVVTLGWIGVPCVGAPCLPADAVWLGPDVSVRRLQAGESWRLGDTSVTVLWPPADPAAELHTNDTSVVLQVSNGKFDAVLTGDAEVAAQRGMIAAAVVGPVEVLKVPHHGSSNGLIGETLAAWSPGVALVSVGARNRFNHPSGATLELLKGAGVSVMRTDRSGDLCVEIARGGYRIAAQRRGELVVVRARMGTVRSSGSAPQPASLHVFGEGNRGGQEHRGSEACLSDLRQRGAAARTRAPPSARQDSRGRGPGLQLRVL
jgi:competence protein ComEC